MLSLFGGVALVGCDGGFGVRAEIVGTGLDPDVGCLAYLEQEGEKLRFTDREVNLTIDEFWVVAPFSEQYVLVVDCPGFESKKLPIRYKKDVEVGGIMDAGAISLSTAEE